MKIVQLWTPKRQYSTCKKQGTFCGPREVHRPPTAARRKRELRTSSPKFRVTNSFTDSSFSGIGSSKKNITMCPRAGVQYGDQICWWYLSKTFVWHPTMPHFWQKWCKMMQMKSQQFCLEDIGIWWTIALGRPDTAVPYTKHWHHWWLA